MNGNMSFVGGMSEGYVYGEGSERLNDGRVGLIEVGLVDEEEEVIGVVRSWGYGKREELNMEEVE